MKSTLVILAAGVGRRFGGLKQIDPVGPAGEALMDYSVFDARRAGFSRVILVVRKETDDLIRKHVDNGFGREIEVEYVYQEIGELPAGFGPVPERAKPWGTGQAVLLTEELIDAPFAVANADDYYGSGGYRQLADFLVEAGSQPSPTFAMVGYTVANTVPPVGEFSRAVCVADDDGWLQNLNEVLALRREGEEAVWEDADGTAHRVGADALVSMNLWGLTPAVFADLRQRFSGFLAADPGPSKEFYIPMAIQAAIAEGKARVRVLPSVDSWCGLTSAGDRGDVRNHLAQLHADGVYPEKLWG
ncbi:MAG: NTP transferase domain-containing protein [bacterium]|nr:NTP transferase domain-containing protein [bacterium]